MSSICTIQVKIDEGAEALNGDCYKMPITSINTFIWFQIRIQEYTNSAPIGWRIAIS